MSGKAPTPRGSVPCARRARGGEGAGEERRAVPLAAIFVAFLRLGLMSFGGATEGWVYRDIVERRRWLDDREFTAGVALSRVMPGSGGVNLTVHVGRLLRGGAGAVILATVLAVGVLRWPMVPVILGLAPVSIGLARLRAKRRGGDG